MEKLDVGRLCSCDRLYRLVGRIEEKNMIQDKRKIIFISSKQDELEQERSCLRNLIEKDDLLSKMFIAKLFEHDLSGREESVLEITKEWVLKSNVYFGKNAKIVVENLHLNLPKYIIIINSEGISQLFFSIIRL